MLPNKPQHDHRVSRLLQRKSRLFLFGAVEIHPCEICSRLNHQLKTGDSAAAVLADVYQKTCTNLGEADDLRALLRHYRGTMKLLVYGKKIREWKYPWKVSLLVYIDKKQS